MPAPDPADYNAALSYFRSRVPMLEDEFQDLRDDVRDQAFTVAGVAQLGMVTDVWESLDDAIATGTTFADFKAAVGEQLSAAWGGDQPWRLSTIFRTWCQRSYGAGRYETMTDPAVLKDRPYWQFLGVADDRQSDICEACDGTVRPASDSWWMNHNPPLHPNCRSTVVTLTAEEAQDEGLDDTAPDADPAEGFGAPPTMPWVPDVSDYPAALVATYSMKLAG